MNPTLNLPYKAEYAKSARSSCKGCITKIDQHVLRLAVMVQSPHFDGKHPNWFHESCFFEEHCPRSVAEIAGFTTLCHPDQTRIKETIGELMPAEKAAKGKKRAGAIEDFADENERPFNESEVPVKRSKEEPNDDNDGQEIIKKQNELFFECRDKLRHCNKNQLHELLTYNNQQILSAKDCDLPPRDRVADCMVFGALKPCPKCPNGQLVLRTHIYSCTGHLTEWTKCQYTTRKPERTAFKVPEEVPLVNFEGEVRERVFEYDPPSTTIMRSGSELNAVMNERPRLPLEIARFFIYRKTEVPEDDLKKEILNLGGSVATELNENLAAVISSKEDVERMPKEMEEIQEKDIQVVEGSYLDLIDKDKGTPSTSLQLIKENNIASWGSDPMNRVPQDVTDVQSVPDSDINNSSTSGLTKHILKGGTVVDPDSGLENEAHVYEGIDGKMWTVVLSLTDVVADKNSFYKLQLLEGDRRKRYWVSRSYGRIGTTDGGNQKDECASLADAIIKFKGVFEDQTGNDWYSYTNNGFKKVAGKKYPIDMDYGNDAPKTKKLQLDENCKLPSSVQKLIIKLFDINLMKQVMQEFELDVEKMPLGKLSKKQIWSGYEVLSELMNCIEEGKKDGMVDQDRIIDATNRFYTLVPHSFGVGNPPLLSDERSIKSKVQMLGELMDIEIAYSLLTSGDKDESLDQLYTELKTQIEPLDRRTAEFEMIQKYVKNDHGATHSQYTLDIHEVYKVARDGEDKRFEPFKNLDNRRLLWHGSRTTNFVGILSEGLRIAPPEAPFTNDMFGKGIYFADMVSKAANYCCTNKNDNIGFMLYSGLRIAPPEAPFTNDMFGKGIYFADMVSQAANYCCTNKNDNIGFMLYSGLRIAPPEAPFTNDMFGKGIYFADMVSKAANYCCTNKNDNIGFMLYSGLRIAPPEAPFTNDMFGKGIYFADMVSQAANYCCTNKNDNIGFMLYSGLRIAPPEAPFTNDMFGKGIYFADMVSKAANYCCTNKNDNIGFMLYSGLRIAPPEAPFTNDMFGKGIYFADMVSKAANYCCTNKNDNIGIMLLCEVALGNMMECRSAKKVTRLPSGTHSVWGKGRTQPCDTQHHVLEDGTIVPLGVAKEVSNYFTKLQYNDYNEFIVYDVAQVKVKYLLEMKFNYNL